MIGKTILITGGAGFIGSALVRFILQHTTHQVINVDKLTYAANLSALASVAQHPRYTFVKADICDANTMAQLLATYQVDAIMHLAAESHVDRSIAEADAFMHTNIMGTYTLLKVAHAYWQGLTPIQQQDFRFQHISTDEVYGDLAYSAPAFTEQSPYAPSSPYSASKAASDHLVRAWARTYGLPTLITHASNNYGPYQHSEKFIPKMISLALQGKPLTLYGNGQQVRDWLYVEDHVQALYQVLTHGQVGETYNVGGNYEMANVEVLKIICQTLENLVPHKPTGVEKYSDLITYVQDRPGHDKRYALDTHKLHHHLNWQPQQTFTSGLQKTVAWFVENREY